MLFDNLRNSSVITTCLLLLVNSISIQSQELDFGGSGGTNGGGGSFTKFVPKNDRAIIGTIPQGIRDLYIELTAENDLDIELWHGDVFVVGWIADGKDAIIYSGSEISHSYNGTDITWSGWNGVNGKLGNEYIQINGVTNSTFEMRVFGFSSGNVEVVYSWAGIENDEGSTAADGQGNFTKYVPRGDRVVIGTIPKGISNLSIDLSASQDLDIELYDGDFFVVGWKVDGQSAYIYHNAQVTGYYNGVSITWSGWDGVDGKFGNEFIRINGTTQNPFQMKVYGYKAGDVEVDYNWGGDFSVIFDIASWAESVISIFEIFSKGSVFTAHVDVVGTIEHIIETGKFEIKIDSLITDIVFSITNLIDNVFGTNLTSDILYQIDPDYSDQTF